MDDEEENYWEPADSINELYKQLSLKKHKEIEPHELE